MEVSVQSCSFFMIIIFLSILLHNYVEADEYEDCRRPFVCGNVILSYPFYDNDQNRPEYCGYPGYEVECHNDSFPEISVATPSSSVTVRFYLLQMNPDSQTISVAREDLWNTYCPEDFHNTSLNSMLYNFAPTVKNITLYYNCQPIQNPNGTPDPYQLSCTNTNNPGSSNPNPYNNIPNVSTPSCATNILVPVNESAARRIRDSTSLQSALQNGFELEWIADNGSCNGCLDSGGVCGYDSNDRSFTCYRGMSLLTYAR